MRNRFLTKKQKAEIQKSYRTKKGQRKVKALWRQLYEGYCWLEDYRIPE